MSDYRYNMSPRDYAWIQQYISRLQYLEKDYNKLQDRVSSLERKLDRLEITLKDLQRMIK